MSAGVTPQIKKSVRLRRPQVPWAFMTDGRGQYGTRVVAAPEVAAEWDGESLAAANSNGTAALWEWDPGAVG